jgi:pilus assembly protein CpaE
VVDTFPLLSSLNLSLMDLSDEVLLITEGVVPSLRSARHNLEMFKKAGYNENRIRIILNKYTRFKGNVSPELVQETLAWPIKSVIPYDKHSTIAANSGLPLVQMFPDHDVTLAIADLVDDLTGLETPAGLPETFIQRQLRLLRNWININ